MKKTILIKIWEEKHDARYGAPVGTDVKQVEITHHEFMGRVYQTEIATCNGVVVYSGEYPAGTEYAAKRIAKYV